MARESKTRYAILGCLVIKPMTAYEIMQFMKQYTHHFWTEREGQLYPTFKQLLSEGLVSFTEETSQKSGVKKIFSITIEGRNDFNHWFSEETEVPIGRNATLLKLFFGRSQPINNTIKMLADSLAYLKEKQDMLLTIQTILEAKHQEGIDVSYYQLTLEYGLMMGEAEINWYEHSIQKLKNKGAL